MQAAGVFVHFMSPRHESPTDASLRGIHPSAPDSISRANGTSIGEDADGKKLAAVRFNFRIPFGTRYSQKFKSDAYELETIFGTPEIEAQKRMEVPAGAEQADWKKFDDWKKFVGKLCDSADGKELLNAPIGPLLLEKVSDGSALKDIILNKKKRDRLKEEAAEVKEELKETAKLLEGLWKDEALPEESPEPTKVAPSPARAS